ncbi:MAG: GAF domain-containing protein [Steroidobacteraceae bacterium]|jgi:GAF domain-containing protein
MWQHSDMRVVSPSPVGPKEALYRELCDQALGLFAGERDGLANAANLTAMIYAALQDLNWVGFYFLQGDELVLGPFQGKVACVRIALARGVCGTAAARRETIVVPDVHAFPGHIACDAASQSEIVVPLLQDDRLFGVLDLDSPFLGRFDAEDAAGLKALVAVFLACSELKRLAD